MIQSVLANFVKTASFKYRAIATDEEVVPNVIQIVGFQVRLLQVTNYLATMVLKWVNEEGDE